jgi:hypothetical protein
MEAPGQKGTLVFRTGRDPRVLAPLKITQEPGEKFASEGAGTIGAKAGESFWINESASGGRRYQKKSASLTGRFKTYLPEMS